MSKIVSFEAAKKNWPVLNRVKILLGTVAVDLDSTTIFSSLVCDNCQLPLTRVHPQDIELICPNGDTKVKLLTKTLPSYRKN